MMINKLVLVMILFLASITMVSCGDDKPVNNQKQLDPKEVSNNLAEIHKRNIKIEDQQIDDYLARRNWDFVRTKSGLRYQIYKKGIGLQPKEGQRVVLEYTVNLIRGDVIYDSKKDGLKIFIIGKGDEPSGLQEAVQYMKMGARAKLILPSYLAYGLIGDENKVPASATLFYDLYLKEVN